MTALGSELAEALVPYLEIADGQYLPTPVAQGPWGETIAGHVSGGLLAWSLERDVGDPAWQPTRLTVDLLRPARLSALSIQTRTVRDGRRIRLAEATMTQGGDVVARASAMFLRRGEQPEQQVWTAPVTMPVPPEVPVTEPRRSPFFLRAYGWGPAAPIPGIGTDAPPIAPKHAWIQEVRPLVDSLPLTPFTRAAMAADVTNPLTHWGTAGMRFINADYTLSLCRLPEEHLIGLTAQTHANYAGIATGVATLVDGRGVIGTCTANAVSDTRFKPPHDA